mmetsp:Transcript_26715/g.61557  ORF Transcript_26715/g.61557 Transcript_26715/m.61557 type:complete len:289 (+) Transcript_26715:768-1634(+)
MYLKHWKEVTSAARPSRMTWITQVMSALLDVKGAAMDASASERETPTWAAFNAPQSLAPSPQKPTVLRSDKSSTRSCFCSGCMRANTLHRSRTKSRVGVGTMLVEPGGGGGCVDSKFANPRPVMARSMPTCWYEERVEVLADSISRWSSAMTSASVRARPAAWPTQSPGVWSPTSSESTSKNKRAAPLSAQSPRKRRVHAVFSGSKPQDRATLIAVRAWSPVTINEGISAADSCSIAPVVAGLSLFSMTRRPRTSRLHSTSARRMRWALLHESSGAGRCARASTRKPL